MPSTAAQCVAYIACAELPQGSWPEMMTILTNNVTNQNSTEMLKESSLEAVGYICQDIVSINWFVHSSVLEHEMCHTASCVDNEFFKVCSLDGHFLLL
jgi:hypothetical protein